MVRTFKLQISYMSDNYYVNLVRGHGNQMERMDQYVTHVKVKESERTHFFRKSRNVILVKALEIWLRIHAKYAIPKDMLMNPLRNK